MARYSFPDVKAVEVSSQDGPIRATSLGYGCLIGVTEKGPVGTPVRCRSFDSWKKIFGNYETRSDMAYEAKLFFDEGGFELITIRQAHYTDVDDKTTFVGGIASHTYITDGVAATAASKTGSVGTYNLVSSGLTVIINVDGAGALTSTFTATETDRRGTGATYASMTGKTLIVSFEDLVQQTVLFSVAATDAASTAAEINAQIYGGHAELVDSDEVGVFSDMLGSSGRVQFHAASTALTELGTTSGTTTNVGSNVADIRAVTSAEFETRIEAATTAEVVLNDDGSFTIYSPTTGITSTLVFTGTGLTPFGLTAETITGTAAGATFNTLKLESGYRGTKNPGVYGNRLKASIANTPFHPSAVAGSELTVAIVANDDHIHLSSPRGLNPGSVLKITDGTNTEYKIVDKVTTTVSGGTPSFIVELTSQLVYGYLVAATTVNSCEFDIEVSLDGVVVENWNGLSMYDSASNYVEAIINDESTGSAYIYATDLDAGCGEGADLPDIIAATAFSGGTSEITALATVDWIGSSTGKTGLYAMDELDEMLAFSTVGNNSAGLFHSAALYAKNRMWFEYVGYCTLGASATANITYRETTLGVNSSYACLYAGGVKVTDPLGLGTSPKRSIAGVGAQLGLRSRVDNLSAPNGGPWQSPSGEGEYGSIYSALDVVDKFTNEEHGLMNDAHINVIRKFTKTSFVTTWGARTLDASADQKFMYNNTRRQFQFFEKSIVDSTRWSVFRNNDDKLWRALKNRILSFLGTYLGVSAYPSTEADKAFYVKLGIEDGTMDQADVNSGYVRGRIGIAPQKAAEFIEFQFAQYTAGADVTE